ncbi:NAD(P)-binding protein [Aaosphaeria arxii CBS 175.79]|uniref:NAD(P)-binding protein n=1 Tax=Aaosphaeria arxii CBS 175.79 TaxID=1450172 RepID=A0A6A5XR10_9PLEO|nr:NAD(P)-binding protein [Aaosphaeria arxii CBS 175.79]KAF2015373.1 NAD(P)-binding protein [Aaosphaeria arxii CBS 175.79]
MTDQHTVYRLSHRKDFSGITAHQEDIPTPQPHEVLIQVRNVALNYRDISIATSRYVSPVKENLIPCSDLAGSIAALGSAVTDFSLGDRVVAAFDPTILYGPRQGLGAGLGGMVDGVLRAFVALPSTCVVRIPEDEGEQRWGEWASLVCTGVTAWNALFGNVPLMPGQSVLCQGTGGVSITALVFAKAAGATVIVTSSSDEKLEMVKRRFGADHTVNYETSPDWAEDALRITKGRGVDFVIENCGSGTISQSLKAVAYGGIVACIGFLSPAKQEDMPDVAKLALLKGAVVRGIQVGSKQMLEDVVRFVAARNLRIPIDREFGFSREEVVRAYEYVRSGKHVGKVCIKVS